MATGINRPKDEAVLIRPQKHPIPIEELDDLENQAILARENNKQRKDFIPMRVSVDPDFLINMIREHHRMRREILSMDETIQSLHAPL